MNFYADIEAAGGLAGVLRGIAVGEGVDVPFAASGADPVGHAFAASVLGHRADLTVSAYTWKRHWSISGRESHQNLALIEGDTGDLAGIVRVAHAWHSGTSLADIPPVAPFVQLTGRFEVPGGEPAQLVESEWQHLRVEAAERDGPWYRALIEAAYAEPVLRALYPFTSHWTLRFSTTPRPHLDRIGPCLDATEDGYFLRARLDGTPLLITAKPESLVAGAARVVSHGFEALEN